MDDLGKGIGKGIGGLGGCLLPAVAMVIVFTALTIVALV